MPLMQQFSWQFWYLTEQLIVLTSSAIEAYYIVEARLTWIPIMLSNVAYPDAKVDRELYGLIFMQIWEAMRK